MHPVTQGVWTVPSDLRFAGLRLNTRMTICQVSEGGLVVISPIPLRSELKRDLRDLGEVRAIVAPNLLHHLSLGEWMDAFPEAESHAPPGLAAKRPDLAVQHVLGSAFDQAFGGDLRRLPIDGMPKLNESLFFHRASRTLIATDFCFFLPDATGMTRLFTRWMGIDKKTKCEPLFRALVRDRSAFRASLAPLRTLRIELLSMCHHHVITHRASESLKGVLDQLKVPDAEGAT